MRKKTFIIYWGPVLLVMTLIFIGSSDLFSSEHTSRFIGPFLRWFNPGVTDDTVRSVQLFVRKMAHLTEYAVLAVLILRAFRKDLSAGNWSWKLAWLALGISCLYAISDEWHQSFVPSRGASVVDVMIDTAGAAIGISIYRAFVKRRNCGRRMM